MNELDRKISKIKNVFDLEKVLETSPDQTSIPNYYAKNRLAYSLFQSSEGFLHMGISRNGKFKKSDLKEQAKEVEKLLDELPVDSKILELACGRGSNSAYLAKKHENIQFHGVDLSPGQLRFAYEKAAINENLNISQGDFHDLREFDSNLFQICFVIEALCHSTKKDIVLNEVERILAEKGVFIVIDGYLNKSSDKLTENEKVACRLTEIGMAVEKFEPYESFLKKVSDSNFKIVSEENVSELVLPSMHRLERYSKIFFKFPHLARLIVKIFPEEFVYNSLSGYLMPTLIKEGIASYMITVLQKT